MASRDTSIKKTETVTVSLIVQDINYLRQLEEIQPDEINEVISKLKSDEAKVYIQHLARGSKPETALREAFFAGQSILNKSIFGDLTPEVREKDGFIDYYFTIGGRQRVLLELKPLFKQKFKKTVKQRKIEKLERLDLDYEQHLPQITKYLRGEEEQECEYEILSNLAEWTFFNTDALYGAGTNKPFLVTDLASFASECERVGSIEDFLKRQEYQARQEELDEFFFKSLKSWVDALLRINFTVDDARKLELVVHLLNKFIFIQTLDYYAAVDFRMIQTLWEEKVRKWKAKGKDRMIKEFLSEINSWFFEHYDTELFREDVMQHIDNSESNLVQLHETLEVVLGLKDYQSVFAGVGGITQFNFRRINEDIFGKAYETLLAEVRHDNGIYYTPSYITDYIVKITVANKFNSLLQEILQNIKEENFENMLNLVKRFITIKVFDPACGSGSFLVKALREIWYKYNELTDLLNKLEEKYGAYSRGTLDRSQELAQTINLIIEAKELIQADNDRQQITFLLIRHLHGNDLDKRALEVAKVNIWLEAVKLSPISFKYSKLPKQSNRILPSLEMNLTNGDSLVGLADNAVINVLSAQFHEQIEQLTNLRNNYFAEPTNTELLDTISEIKSEIKENLDRQFRNSLPEQLQQITTQTLPFHFALDYWYVFFDGTGNPLSEEDKGFDVVIGNPPYIDSETMTKSFPLLRDYCTNFYAVAKGNWDCFCIFIERGITLVKRNGKFSFIVPNKLLGADYADATRNFIKQYKLESIRDYSTVKPFKDASVYPIVFALTNIRFIDTDEATIETVSRNENALEISYINTVPLTRLYNISDNNWTPMVDPTFVIFESLMAVSEPISPDHASALGGATVSEAYEITKLIRELDSTIEKKEEYFKFINTGTVDKYVSLWGAFPTQYIKKKYQHPVMTKKDLMEFSETRYNQASSSKIIIGGMGKELECFFDDGSYLAGKSTVIILSDKVDLRALSGVLNSKIASFIFKRMFENLALQGGYMRIGPPQVNRITIPREFLRSESMQQNLSRLVSDLMILKHNHYHFKAIWTDYCNKLTHVRKPFSEILDEDLDNLKEGKPEKLWFSRVSFYLESKNQVLEEIYDAFDVRADSDSLLLEIYGLNGNGDEKLLYSAMTQSIDLFQHIYLSILALFDSSRGIKTLRHILMKTKVPVTTSNPLGRTPNIMKDVNHQFKQTMQDHADDVPSSVIEIDNLTKEKEAEIDAIVAKLFEVNETQLTAILHSSNTPRSYVKLVRTRFNQIDLDKLTTTKKKRDKVLA